MESDADDAANSPASTSPPPASSSRVLEEFAPFPYQSLNEDREIVGVNAVWLETLGYEREEVIGETFETFLDPDSVDGFENTFSSLKSEGSISERELELTQADGSSVSVSYSGQAEYDENDEFLRTHSQFQDITKQRQAETELREQRDRFLALTGAIPDVVVLYDSDGVYEDIITGQSQLLVADEDELVGKSVSEVLDSEVATTIQGAIDKTLSEGDVTSREYQLSIDGDPKWFEARVAPLAGEEPEKVVLTARDITARKKQEEELRRTKKRFEMAIHGANLGVWDWDMETHSVSRHANLRDMLGYSPVEFGGHLDDWEDLVHPEGKSRHDEAFETHISEDTEYYECDYRLRTRDGDWKWIRNIGKVVEWKQDGSPARAVGIHIDIDKQKRAMEELSKKTNQLEALNRVVRHDIRNDMNIVHGWAQELEGHVDEEGRKALERVLEVSKHVINITTVAREFVDTLGDDETVDLETVSLGKQLRAEIEARQETHPDADIELSGKIPRIKVRANEMLSAVFRNLLENAVQHKQSGTPEIRIEAVENPDSVVVTVADNGPGIPDARKEEVFGKGEMGLESGGTGMGLHLVHSLVTGFGGEVWIEDNEPEGAVFYVELPKANSQPESA